MRPYQYLVTALVVLDHVNKKAADMLAQEIIDYMKQPRTSNEKQTAKVKKHKKK